MNVPSNSKSKIVTIACLLLLMCAMLAWKFYRFHIDDFFSYSLCLISTPILAAYVIFDMKRNAARGFYEGRFGKVYESQNPDMFNSNQAVSKYIVAACVVAESFFAWELLFVLHLV